MHTYRLDYQPLFGKRVHGLRYFFGGSKAGLGEMAKIKPNIHTVNARLFNFLSQEGEGVGEFEWGVYLKGALISFFKFQPQNNVAFFSSLHKL